MVPKTGIEPVRKYKFRRILSPVRLPVPPLRHTFLAPREGLEPSAYRLTAECSTIELPWNMEATPRFELGIKELQSTALPLGYVAILNKLGWIMRVELTTSRATIWRSNQLSYTHHIKFVSIPTAAFLQERLMKWRARRDSNPRPTA